MTTDEKLKKCMDFLDKLEHFCYIHKYDCFDSDGVITYNNNTAVCVSVKAIEDIKDMAWHLKADLSD